MKSNEEIRLIVKQAYTMCSKIMPIHSCWLYGSYARGDSDNESDVDILLTADASKTDLAALRHDVALISSALSLSHDITVSLVIRSSEEFRLYSTFVPFYQNIIREGEMYAG